MNFAVSFGQRTVPFPVRISRDPIDNVNAGEATAFSQKTPDDFRRPSVDVTALSPWREGQLFIFQSTITNRPHPPPCGCCFLLFLDLADTRVGGEEEAGDAGGGGLRFRALEHRH